MTPTPIMTTTTTSAIPAEDNTIVNITAASTVDSVLPAKDIPGETSETPIFVESMIYRPTASSPLFISILRIPGTYIRTYLGTNVYKYVLYKEPSAWKIFRYWIFAIISTIAIIWAFYDAYRNTRNSKLIGPVLIQIL